MITDYQFELGGVTFGKDTPYHELEFSDPKPEARVADAPLARADGRRFGRDYMAGLELGFEIGIEGTDPSEVMDRYSRLRAAWHGDSVRKAPGAVMPLVLKRPGREALRVYGRPRRFEPASWKNLSTGWVEVVCDFATVDHLFYGNEEQTTTVGLIPPLGGGLVTPLVAPFTTVARSVAEGEIFVAGTADTWLYLVIQGPIARPVVETNHWRLEMTLTLADGEFVVIDPRPWSRGVRRNGVANASGDFTQASVTLPEMVIPPGFTEVALRGEDATGTSSVTAAYRPAFHSW